MQTVFCFVVLLSFVDVCLAEFQHAIHNSSEVVSHGGNGFGGSQAGAQPAKFSSQSTLTSNHIPRGQSQTRRPPIDHPPSTAPQNLSPPRSTLRTPSHPSNTT